MSSRVIQLILIMELSTEAIYINFTKPRQVPTSPVENFNSTRGINSTETLRWTYYENNDLKPVPLVLLHLHLVMTTFHQTRPPVHRYLILVDRTTNSTPRKASTPAQVRVSSRSNKGISTWRWQHSTGVFTGWLRVIRIKNLQRHTLTGKYFNKEL